MGMLQNGIKPEVAESMLLEQKLYSSDLVDLFSWKNGCRTEDIEQFAIEKLELFPEGIMMSIQESLTVYNIYTADLFSWQPGLFPIFANGGGSYLLLDLVLTSQTYGKILLYDPVPINVQNIVPIYDSIDLLVQSAIECINVGAYNYKSDQTIALNFELRHQVCAKLNPRSAYWLEV
jgi:hypothetical protein